MPIKVKHFALIAAVLVIAAALFFLFKSKGKQSIVFFSGAGMKVPVSEIVKNFTDSTGIVVDMHFDGSAVLRQYIETYGDVDVFMSGDRNNMDILVQNGFVKEQTFIAWHIPSILIPPENKNTIQGLNDLAKKNVRFVMSNPAQASLGKLVNDMLARHPRGKEILKHAAVYGSDSQDDLRLFRDLYKKGGADAVIEWDVMVHVPEGNGLIVVPFDKKYEIRDSLSIAVLKASAHPEIAKRFFDYFRMEGVAVFKKHGYNTEVGK